MRLNRDGPATREANVAARDSMVVNGFASRDSMAVNGSSLVGGSELGGSELWGNGSELINGSELFNGSELAQATQVAGVLCSISGGSHFLKQSFAADKTVKNRVNLIPRHSSSSFVARNYEVVKELGKGSFSRVQLLRDRRSGAARVLKVSEGGMGTKQSQMLKNEIHLLSALDHPNIIKIFEYSEDISRGQLLMVLEYVGGGDCQQLLRSSAKPQSEAFIAKLIWQLLSVLCYCHARGILHCDIKPENMMLTPPKTKGEMPDCKVIDFGLTHRIDQPTRDFVGTPSYMAPEIVKGTVAYTVKADLWSTGVTACELLATKAPFGRPSDYKGKIDPVLQNIRDYRRFKDIEKRLARSESWQLRSNTAKSFIESLMFADPTDRPHADEAIEHAWLLQNKGAPTMMNADMMKSMARFVGSSSLMRRCLLIIAARVGSPKMERMGQVFLSIDHKHTGRISREELAATVSAAATCWEPEIDVDDFFDAADQDRRDVITFLEFAATCLWGTDDTTNTMAERVFKALDDNHDGLVSLKDCQHLFRPSDLMELRNLPTDRPFGINEFRLAAGGNDDPPRKKREQPKGGYIAQFIRTLMCQEDEPGADDNFEVVCR
jgi:calcium-dependent protein kinase